MAQKHPIKLVALLPMLLLTACSSGEKWPNLSDKLPDVAERNRILEKADSTATPRTTDAAPLTETDALQLLATINNDVTRAADQFSAAMTYWEQSPETDRRSAWMGAQLAVTRLSQTVSRVNNILFNEDLDGSNVQVQAQALKSRIESTVTAARQKLAKSAP